MAAFRKLLRSGLMWEYFSALELPVMTQNKVIQPCCPVSAPSASFFLTRVWRRARSAVWAALTEPVLYACGSSRSYFHGRTALAELDARLRRDIGIIEERTEMKSTYYDGLR